MFSFYNSSVFHVAEAKKWCKGLGRLIIWWLAERGRMAIYVAHLGKLIDIYYSATHGAPEMYVQECHGG